MQFREIIDKNPNKVEAKIIFLDFLNAKARERIVGEYELWLSDNKLEAVQILELSKWMMTNNYMDLAEKGLKQVISTEKNKPLSLNAQNLLGEIALSKKQYDVVEATVKEMLKVDSDFVDASLLKARLLLARNKTDDAIELLNKTVWSRIPPGMPIFYWEKLTKKKMIVNLQRKISNRHWKSIPPI